MQPSNFGVSVNNSAQKKDGENPLLSCRFHAISHGDVQEVAGVATLPNKLLGLTSKQSKPEQIRKLPYFNYPFPDTNQASGGRTQTYDREQKHAASAVVCVRSSAPGVQRKLRILLAKSAGSCVTSPALLQTEVRSLTCEKPPSLGQTRILLDTSVCKRGGGKVPLKKGNWDSKRQPVAAAGLLRLVEEFRLQWHPEKPQPRRSSAATSRAEYFTARPVHRPEQNR